jgi:hypothetical protein
MSKIRSILREKAALKTFLALTMLCALGIAATAGGFAQEVVAIAAGGPAESNASGGDYSFVSDEDFVGGGINSPVTTTIALAQPGVNAAPMAVYQHGRAGGLCLHDSWLDARRFVHCSSALCRDLFQRTGEP